MNLRRQQRGDIKNIHERVRNTLLLNYVSKIFRQPSHLKQMRPVGFPSLIHTRFGDKINNEKLI